MSEEGPPELLPEEPKSADRKFVEYMIVALLGTAVLCVTQDVELGPVRWGGNWFNCNRLFRSFVVSSKD
jgi:hypothetical protein